MRKKLISIDFDGVLERAIEVAIMRLEAAVAVRERIAA